MEEHKYKEEMNITITNQAMAILGQSKHSLKDLKEWIKNTQSHSIGGHNVSLFLEQKSREAEKKKKEQKHKGNDSKTINK